jgi:hypothetical protein
VSASPANLGTLPDTGATGPLRCGHGDRGWAVARDLAGGGCEAFGRELFGQEREHRALQGAGLVVGVAGVGEVSLLGGSSVRS